MICKAETHKRSESVIEVVNDCLNMLHAKLKQEIMYFVIL